MNSNQETLSAAMLRNVNNLCDRDHNTKDGKLMWQRYSVYHIHVECQHAICTAHKVQRRMKGSSTGSSASGCCTWEKVRLWYGQDEDNRKEMATVLLH